MLISIKGQQFLPGLDEEGVIELITPGSLSREGGDYLITYKESQLTGLDGTVTTLRVAGRRVTLSRVGDVSTHLVFEQGHRHLSYYDTGQGHLTVGVSARRVRSALTEAGGLIELDYELVIDDALSGENHIRVSVSELKS